MEPAKELLDTSLQEIMWHIVRAGEKYGRTFEQTWGESLLCIYLYMHIAYNISYVATQAFKQEGFVHCEGSNETKTTCSLYCLALLSMKTWTHSFCREEISSLGSTETRCNITCPVKEEIHSIWSHDVLSYNDALSPLDNPKTPNGHAIGGALACVTCFTNCNAAFCCFHVFWVCVGETTDSPCLMLN